VCCVHETRWTGSGARVMGKGVSRYKFFRQGCKDSNAGVVFLISGRWIDRIVDVKRVNKHIMCLKVSVGECAYVPETGISVEEKDCFWDQMLSVTESIPASGLIIVGGDLNGHTTHIVTNVDGYDGVHGGYGFGDRNVESERLCCSEGTGSISRAPALMGNYQDRPSV